MSFTIRFFINACSRSTRSNRSQPTHSSYALCLRTPKANSILLPLSQLSPRLVPGLLAKLHCSIFSFPPCIIGINPLLEGLNGKAVGTQTCSGTFWAAFCRWLSRSPKPDMAVRRGLTSRQKQGRQKKATTGFKTRRHGDTASAKVGAGFTLLLQTPRIRTNTSGNCKGRNWLPCLVVLPILF